MNEELFDSLDGIILCVSKVSIKQKGGKLDRYHSKSVKDVVRCWSDILGLSLSSKFKNSASFIKNNNFHIPLSPRKSQTNREAEMSGDIQISIADLKTPLHCIADFCLIPIGTPTASVSNEIAVVQTLMKESGLEYHMHSAGTTLGKFTT
jgi:hypothetical protein